MVEGIFRTKIRTLVFFLLVAFLAFFAGEALFKVMAEPSLGSILRHNLGTIGVLALIFAFCNQGFISGIFNLRKDDNLSLKQILFAVLFSISLGVIVFNYSYFGVIYGGIALFILLCLGLSIFYIFSKKTFYSLCIFWCVLPFIYFMQTQGGNLGFERVVYKGLAIPFSAFYISVLFFAFITANLKNRELFANKNFRFAYWLILLSIPSLFFSDMPVKSCVYFSLDMVVPIMFFIIMMLVLKNREQIDKVVQFMLFSVLTFILISFYFYGMDMHKTTHQVSTFLVLPSSLAGMAMLVLAFTFLKYKASNNKLYLGLSLLFIALAIMCNRRSAAIGLIVMFAMFFILSNIPRVKKVQSFIIILICICLLIGIFAGLGIHPAIEHRLITTFEMLRGGVSLDKISSGRVEIWDSAIRMIKDHPIMGIGAGMWQDYAFRYNSKLYTHYYPGYGYSFNYSIDSHNFFLDLYLKYGIFTLVLFVYFLFYTFKKSLLLCRKEADEGIRRLAMGSCIGLSVWVCFAIFGWRFYSFGGGTLIQGFLFWSLVVIIFKCAEISEKRIKGEKVDNNA